MAAQHFLFAPYPDTATTPNTTATSVVAISRVRRLKRQRSQGTQAKAVKINSTNEYGVIIPVAPEEKLLAVSPLGSHPLCQFGIFGYSVT